MLTFSTRQKIRAAGVLQRLVMRARTIMGHDSAARVTRRGIRWSLDLREGIDFSIWLLGVFEPKTVRAYRELVKPGSVVFDIGANIGAHTLHLAAAVGPKGMIIAVEPTDFAFDKIRTNIGLNPTLAPRIRAVQAMLIAPGAASPAEPVYASWPLRVEGEHHPLHFGQLMSCLGARTVTLDNLVAELHLDRVDFLKIDIDGHECAMLRGARNTLRRFRPHIVMEFAPYVLLEHGASLPELLELLAEPGYRLIDADTRAVLPFDAARLDKLIPRGSCRNVLAIPI